MKRTKGRKGIKIAWISISIKDLESKPTVNSLILSNDKLITLRVVQVAGQLITLQIHSLSKLDVNGSLTWRPLEYSNRMNFGNLVKWMRLNRNKSLFAIYSKVNSREYLMNSIIRCNNKFISNNSIFSNKCYIKEMLSWTNRINHKIHPI